MEKNTRKISWKLSIVCTLIALFLGIVWISSSDVWRSIGASEKALQDYLDQQNYTKVEILKVKQEGRIKAVIYEREDIGTCIAVFERRLLGLRWFYTGMNTLKEVGLQTTYDWQLRGSWKGTKCNLVVCGDNRSGIVASYQFGDREEVSRSDLEADWIIDIYNLDGIEKISKHRLMQYRSDGTLFEN